jgi:hypothetical protein
MNFSENRYPLFGSMVLKAVRQREAERHHRRMALLNFRFAIQTSLAATVKRIFLHCHHILGPFRCTRKEDNDVGQGRAAFFLSSGL